MVEGVVDPLVKGVCGPDVSDPVNIVSVRRKLGGFFRAVVIEDFDWDAFVFLAAVVDAGFPVSCCFDRRVETIVVEPELVGGVELVVELECYVYVREFTGWILVVDEIFVSFVKLDTGDASFDWELFV